jgi:hypothetical protein
MLIKYELHIYFLLFLLDRYKLSHYFDHKNENENDY